MRCSQFYLNVIMVCDELRLEPCDTIEREGNRFRYYQSLTNGGNELSIRTPWVELDRLIFEPSSHNILVSVPIDNATRQALDSIESFVKDNVTIPTHIRHKSTSYKALDRRDEMNIAVSSDCWCLHYLSNTTFEMVSTLCLTDYKKCRFRFEMNPYKVCLESCKDEIIFSIMIRMSVIEIKDT